MTEKSIRVQALQRQLEIEAALERVRSRSMGMQSSDELSDVLSVLFQQFDLLGIAPRTAWLTLWNPEEDTFTYRSTGTSGLRIQGQQVLDINGMDIWKDLYEKWKTDTSDSVEVLYYSKEDLKQLFSLMEETFSAMPEGERLTPEQFPDGGYSVQGHCKFGYIGYTHTQEPSEEEKEILTRFATEFGRVYQRFLDIERAEAQAREAQIEAALERVRAKTMAMHNSQDVGNTVITLFQEVMKLGLDNSIRCGIGILEGHEGMETWSANSDKKGKVILKMGMLNMSIHPMLIGLKKAWQKGDKAYSYHFAGSDVTNYYTALNMEPEYPFHVDLSTLPENQFANIFFFTEGILFAFTETQLTEEAKRVLERFASVFGQTYRRYLDLLKAEAQAREAQIEAALERVRARSMAMHQTSELQDVINTVYQQFLELGVDISGGAFIAINDDIDTELICWGAGGTAEYIERVHLPFMDMPIYTEILVGIKKEPGFFTESYSQKEKKAFLTELFKIPPYTEASSAHKKEVLSRPGGYTRSCYVSENTSIFIINHHGRPFSQEDNDILKRMGKVFEQTYTRFLDLQKAEAQAKEAQIEAALERVRARSMAMHHSSELGDVAAVLFDQLNELVGELWTCGFVLCEKDRKEDEWWLSMDGGFTRGFFLPNVGDYTHATLYEGWVKGDDFRTVQLEGNSLQEHYDWLMDIPTARKIFEDMEASGIQRPQWQKLHAAYFSKGYLCIITQVPCQEEEVFKRFAQAFDLTYTRFLDLKKAESQARESQIEAALEKVRSRSLAMHHSDQMQQVADEIFEQLHGLGLEMDAIGMSGVISPESSYEVWVGGSGFTRPLTIPYTDSTQVQRDYNEAIANRPPLFTRTYSGNIKKEYIDFLLSQNDFPEELHRKMVDSEAFSTSIAFAKKSGIQIARYTAAPYSDPENEILKRFCRVFEQAYIRFLDLKNAEAQNRESEIQLALERVRAKAMAMHSTEELGEVLCVLFEQFDFLGINPVLTHLTLFDEENETFSLRITTSPENKILREQIIDVEAVEAWKTSLENWRKGDENTVDCIAYPPEVLPGVWEVMHEVMSSLPEGHKIYPEDFPDGLYTTQGHCKYGYIGFNHNRPATEEEKDIVSRFAAEFGRVYQRFLELNNAEAQARESEIQLALERVRARTMAMHKSEELGEVAAVLFEQIDNLGATPERLNIGIVREEEGVFEWWSTEQGGKQIDRLFKGEISEPTTISKVYAAWKEGRNRVEIEQSGKELQQWIRYLTEVIGLPFDNRLIRDRRVHSAAMFKHGCLLVSSPEFLTEESMKLLERFSNVFEQTYIRFLDLQKAEAQAREAEIQLSLERIRARAMAMQESAELTEVLSVIFQQLKMLGVETVWAHLTLVHLEENAFTYRMTGRNGERIMAEEKIALDASEHWAHISDSIKSPDTDPDPITRFEVPPEGLDAIWELFDGIFSKLPEGEKVSPGDFANGLFTTQAYCKFGFLGINQTREATQEEADILLRFTTEFSRLYQRFLDLQNAEKRAREAKIEASLERIRARAMAMQHTEELNEVIGLLCEQYDFLGINPVCAHLSLIDLENHRFSLRLSGKKGARNVGEKIIDLDAMAEWKETVDRWKQSIPQSHQCLVYKGDSVQELFKVLDDLVQTMPKKYRVGPEDFPNGLYSCEGQNKFGYLGFNHSRPPTEEEIAIVIRFAREFERIYQRFLDLEKAEAQAREAQIEASLERVRAASMAMHNSSELFNVINILSGQLAQLGIEMDAAMINEKVEGSKDWYMWLAIPSGSKEVYTRREQVHVPYIKSAAFDRINRFENEGKSVFSDQLTKSQKDYIFRHYFKNSNHRDVPQARQDFILSRPGLSRTTVLSKNSYIQFYRYSLEVFSEVEKQVLERFGGVFEQSYTRFLDLKKAETQAREAQIEAALERVRAKTMAMHNTEDIADTVITFFNELIGLGLGNSTRCGIGILNHSQIMEVWTASIQKKNKSTLHTGFLEMNGHPMLMGLQKAWSKGESLYEKVLKGDDKMSYFKAINKAPDYPVKVDLETLPPAVYHYSFLFSNGTLFVFSESPLHEEIRDIFTRFSSVFGQTYTRYLDLERAEKQARESKIEAALERVRAKALAMHGSEDLRETITTIFEELKNLNVKTLRMGLGLLNPDKPEGEIVTSRIGDNDEIIEVSGTFELVGHPILDGIYEHFKKQLDHFPILEGDEINSYYAALTKSVDVQGHGTDSRHYGCFLYFPEGCLYAWAAQQHSEAQIEILKKFSRVVEITYRRYNDLIESEAREKEAIKQASLDRVRAEIASMRTTEDLERITPLVWKELTTLGIPFFRCGVFIMDEVSQLVHVYLTTPQGEALAAMDLPFDFDMSLIQKGVEHWRKQEPLVEEWNQKQFIEMTKKLMKQGQVKSVRSYQAGEKPPERLVLHQVPFAQGMLYVGSAKLLSTDEMDIVQALTRTFAVAYARYEDFKELENAKKKVENTLTDLKATQAQLIQSEKMASLGELTAGIAHEIKNPLNFVNNFSEVSRELLEELMEEMENGDLEEVRALAGDVIQNLEKIVHHGQRADSIVKGMLQHSRSGDGKKEPTDLNELADEYLRLAYHGLRAKDKSFNATMETSFDPELPEIDIVPQDIGRVLLNLFTNAFYAVNEKKKTADKGYTPSVTAGTKQQGEWVEIAISDNGTGIPEHVKDKIFQPFFTTKPTGEGTGLGLSLSYDIVKAHGGELNVTTEEGEGTTFFIKFKPTS